MDAVALCCLDADDEHAEEEHEGFAEDGEAEAGCQTCITTIGVRVTSDTMSSECEAYLLYCQHSTASLLAHSSGLPCLLWAFAHRFGTARTTSLWDLLM